MQRNKVLLEDKRIANLKQFVDIYSVFGNEMDLFDQINDDEKVIFDWLKKYKLASSEGLNKHTNRMIRHSIMRDFLFNLTDELSVAEKSLYIKMKGTAILPTEDPDE